MSAAKTYMTNQGEAWDQIAKRLWGSETMVHHLLAANPDQRHVVIFSADIALTVPDVAPPVQEEPPPWQSR